MVENQIVKMEEDWSDKRLRHFFKAVSLGYLGIKF